MYYLMAQYLQTSFIAMHVCHVHLPPLLSLHPLQVMSSRTMLYKGNKMGYFSLSLSH